MDPKEEADPIEAEPSATSDLPDSATVSAPVYVEYPGGGEEEDSVPPPPTSPFRKELPQAPQVQDTFRPATHHLDRPGHLAYVEPGAARRTKQSGRPISTV
jgi:hypothetical protein